jgi:hypothetical protein
MRQAIVKMQEDLGTIVLRNPPQNRLSQEFFQELRDGMSDLLEGREPRSFPLRDPILAMVETSFLGPPQTHINCARPSSSVLLR